MEKKKYEINGKKYTQGPLVLGQLMPLCELIEGVKIPDFTVVGIVAALGTKLSRAMALILVPEGCSAKDRDIDAMVSEFEGHMEIAATMEVVADFLSFNPISSLLENARAIMGSFKTNLEGVDLEGLKGNGISSESSANSPEETSPEKTGSSGMSPFDKLKSGSSSTSNDATSG